MFSFRTLVATLLLAGLIFAADTPAIDHAANLVEHRTAQMPKGQALEFRLMAAQTLQPRYPALAQKFIDGALQELRANKDLATPTAKHALATLAPTEAAAMFPPPPAAPKPAPATRPTPPPELAAISKKMGQMRGLPTDADRARLVLETVADIRARYPPRESAGAAEEKAATGIGCMWP